MDDFEVNMYSPKRNNLLKYLIVALLIIAIAVGCVLIYLSFNNENPQT